MHYLILISLSTDRESSILRVVLLSYKQTDNNKRFQRGQRRARDDYEDDDDEERRNSRYSFE